MMKLRSKVAAALTIAATTAFAVPAGAACSFTGKISRTYATTYGSNDYSYFYVVPETASPHGPSYTFYTRIYGSDTAILGNMNAALAANHTVRCSGDRSGSCPTSGTYRWAGNANYCYVYRNQ